MRNIYVVLSRSGTYVSSFLYKATKFEFTHVSLIIDEPFNEMYSFGRRILNYPLVGGFVVEKLRGGFYEKFPETLCVVFTISVTDEQYNRIEKSIKNFLKNYRKHKYSFIGLATAKLGVSWDRKYKFTCSQFVAHVLSQNKILSFDKNPSLIKPIDFYKLGLDEVYRGELIKLYGFIPQNCNSKECKKA